MYYYNDKPLPLDKAFTDVNGNQYPANWLRNSTQAQRDALGITWVAPNPESYFDQRFYWGIDNPKDIDELKQQWITEQKNIAATLLAPTDWYLIRQTEVPEEVCPSEILQERADIRDISGQRENQINACIDVAELEKLITAPAMISVVVQDFVPETTDDPEIPEVRENQINPDALILWPKELEQV